jgi:anhydro-N-acetylmuramic acid kinase
MLRVIGLMSGTSVDGIDAALVEISGSTRVQINLIAAHTYPYPPELRQQILDVAGGAALAIAELASLDDAIAHAFAQAALTLQVDHAPADLIGSHGQTVYHRPPEIAPDAAPHLGYSLQLGRGELIAHLTGIPTISNFRAADIAAGGQGAPLVSPIDACLLSHPTLNRCIQNIGGISNVTYLPATTASTHPLPILGWDTGPGNMLLDLAVQHFSQGTQTYDQDGAWAATGTPCQDLVTQWLQQDFFHQPPPKSTGRERFGQAYWQQCLGDAAPRSLSAADMLATLTELTAAAIAQSYQNFLPQRPDQVLLCGGGSQNHYLKQRLQAHLAPVPVLTTDEAGLNADAKEAIAFAVLAYWRHFNLPSNLPEVTGAKSTVSLGEIHPIFGSLPNSA